MENVLNQKRALFFIDYFCLAPYSYSKCLTTTSNGLESYLYAESKMQIHNKSMYHSRKLMHIHVCIYLFFCIINWIVELKE